MGPAFYNRENSIDYSSYGGDPLFSIGPQSTPTGTGRLHPPNTTDVLSNGFALFLYTKRTAAYMPEHPRRGMF
jgi:hypothetical protein